jgi:hypothetical protein
MLTTPTNPPSVETDLLSREETAWLMKAVWSALQSPAWTFQNKKDLEKLGEALFSGKALKDLDEKTLDRIFPHLVTVTQHLRADLKAKRWMSEQKSPGSPSELSSPPAQAPQPSLAAATWQHASPEPSSPPAQAPQPLAVIPPKTNISPSSTHDHDDNYVDMSVTTTNT